MSFLKYTLIVIVSIVLATVVLAKKIEPLYKDYVIKEVSLNAQEQLEVSRHYLKR